MYVANTLASSLNEWSLFGVPKDIRQKTLLPIADDDVERLLDAVNDRFETPVDVLVNERVSSASRLDAAVNERIASASSRNSTINSFLVKVKEKLEQAAELAEEAAESMDTSSIRTELNIDAQALLTQIGEMADDATYDGESILRGGSFSLAVTPDGAETTLQNGDARTSSLGIDDLDLTTVADAEAAETALESAITNVEGQIELNDQQGETLTEYYEANSERTTIVAQGQRASLSREYAQTALENVEAAIRANTNYALSVQESNLRNAVFNNLFEGVVKIGDLIKSTDEKREDDQVERERSDLEEAEKDLEPETTPSELLTGNAAVDSDMKMMTMDAENSFSLEERSVMDQTAKVNEMAAGIVNIGNLIQSQSPTPPSGGDESAE